MSTERSSPTGPRTSIRTKLLIGLAVPVVFVALISGVQAKQAQDDLSDTKKEVKLALAAGGPTTYITALLDERNITALDLLGLTGAVELDRVKSVADARKKTDEAQTEFEASLAKGGAQVQDLYGSTFDEARSQLSSLRDESDAIPQSQRNTENAAAERIYDEYSNLISRFHTANADAVGRIDDAQLRNRADAIAAQTRSSDLLSLMSRTAALSFIYDITIDDQLDVQQHFAQFESSRTQAIDDLADDPAAQQVMRGFYERASMKRFYTAIQNFAETGEVADVPKLIADAASVKYPNGTDAWQAARASLQDRGDALIAASERSRNLYVAVFFFATLISLAFALLIARSISRPLISISQQAEDMATNRLPQAVGAVLATPIGDDVVEPELEPIAVKSTDETALVADSINDVQRRALDLAVEQAIQRRNFADTFLNLGRRVQGLVNRQLEFITDLEDEEQDPETLSDLFKLDHLATRIRRNAESLVVLAGVTRRSRRGEATPILDALRSALGEVDEYTRVVISDVDDARLPMSVAADLSHILAELLENGLNFSPPDTDVVATGRITPTGYRITVVDHGIGMNADQVATANRRLSGNESFTVAPSRYMGHYVAGHLATSLGIDIRLTSSEAGTTATVDLGPELLASESAETDEHADGFSEPDQFSIDGASNGADVISDDPEQRPSEPGVTSTFEPQAPPRSDSLHSLLAAHRRLSRPRDQAAADRSPWATAPATADDESSTDAVDNEDGATPS